MVKVAFGREKLAYARSLAKIVRPINVLVVTSLEEVWGASRVTVVVLVLVALVRTVSSCQTVTFVTRVEFVCIVLLG